MIAQLEFSSQYEGEIFASQGGYEVDSGSPYWQLNKNIKVAVWPIVELLPENLLFGFKKTLVHYAKKYSAHHTKNLAERMLHMQRFTEGSGITEGSLISYRAALTRETEWYFSSIRGFLTKWCDLGYPGVERYLIDAIQDWRIKGNIKGDAVQRLDPTEGPLSEIEQQEFNDKTVAAYERGLISLGKMAMCLMLSNSGRRADQIVRLRAKHVVDPKGTENYYIDVPRAKQRGAPTNERTRRLAITQELWTVMNAQAQASTRIVCRRFGQDLPAELTHRIPLFLDVRALQRLKSIKELAVALGEDVLFARVAKVAEAASDVVELSGVISHRTGEELKANPIRFRYSFATRAARRGYGVLIIAELLDHTDTQNAGVYIKSIPDHVKHLDKAVAHQLAPYAQAFSGTLIDCEADATRAGDLRARVRCESGGLGSCGGYGFCGANVPIPCYTCANFQPWVDGPHEDVLSFLVEQRENIIAMTGDHMVAGINDRTILAVTQVVQLCAARRAELGIK